MTRARAVVNRCGSPVSARIAAAPTGDRPVMLSDQLGQLELVEDGDHPGLGVGQLGLGVRPSPPAASATRSSAPGRCAITPAGSARAANRCAHDPQARFGLAAAGDLACAPRARTGPAPGGGCGPGRRRRGPGPRVIAATQVVDRNGCLAASRAAGQTHSSRSRICWTHAHVLLDQLLAAGAQVPQPAPGLIDRFGQVAAQLRGQPGDQHRVLLVGLVDWSGPRSCAPTRSASAARTRTASPGPRRAGPAPATGARSAHTTTVTPANPARRRARRPSPTPHPGPRPCTGTSAAPAPSSRGR